MTPGRIGAAVSVPFRYDGVIPFPFAFWTRGFGRNRGNNMALRTYQLRWSDAYLRRKLERLPAQFPILYRMKLAGKILRVFSHPFSARCFQKKLARKTAVFGKVRFGVFLRYPPLPKI